MNTKAVILIKEGNYQEAEEILTSALEESPKEDYLLINLGFVMLMRNKIEEAIEKFKEALRINPNSQIAKQNLLVSFKYKVCWLYKILCNNYFGKKTDHYHFIYLLFFGLILWFPVVVLSKLLEFYFLFKPEYKIALPSKK